MNFLAHLWLADRAGADLGGAILGDFARGRIPADWPEPVARSIRLHRRIDALTDADPVVVEARTGFPHGPRRFAGIFLDLLWDHLLARDWGRYHALPLRAFSGRAARSVADAAPCFRACGRRAPPAPAFRALLLSYARPVGFEKALRRTARRLSRPEGLLSTLDNWEVSASRLQPSLSGLLDRLSAAGRSA